MYLTDEQVDRLSAKLAEFSEKRALDELLNDYATLLEDYRRVKNNWEEACSSRDRYKQEAKGHDKGPFALVLVDGDGYLFQDSLVKGQGEGGAEAARRLHGAIKADLGQKGLDTCQIMIRVYANVAGLSKALAAADLVGKEARSLAKFIAGFNRQYGLVDFVDAGDLKENADFKLREMLRLYGDSAQCKHIYFAGTHDVGYISELTPFAKGSKCTLLRSDSVLFHPEFEKLGLSVKELQDVFRPTALSNGKSVAYAPGLKTAAATQSSNRATITKSTDVSKERPICRFYPNCKYGANCMNLHVGPGQNLPWRPPTGQTSGGNGTHNMNDGLPLSSLGKVPGDGQPPPSETAQTFGKLAAGILPGKAEIPVGQVAIDPAGRRIDPEVPLISKATIDKFDQRHYRYRLCNNFHLTGSCEAGSHCKYDHSPIDNDLHHALERLARSNPCTRRGSCRIAMCTSGHVCQEIDCYKRGGKRKCRLPIWAHFTSKGGIMFVPAVLKSTQEQPETLSRSTSGRSDDTSDSTVSPEEDEEVQESGGISIASA